MKYSRLNDVKFTFLREFSEFKVNYMLINGRNLLISALYNSHIYR